MSNAIVDRFAILVCPTGGQYEIHVTDKNGCCGILMDSSVYIDTVGMLAWKSHNICFEGGGGYISLTPKTPTATRELISGFQ